MTERDAKPSKTFDSYLGWMQEAENAHCLTEQHALGSQGAMLFGTSQSDVFSDPPTPDLTLQLCTGGSYWLKGNIGGDSFYEPQVEAGMFGVALANEPLELEGRGRFDMMLLALPWAKMQPLVQAAAGREVTHFGPLHTRMYRDPTIETLMHALWREQNREGANGALFADSVTMALLAQLLRLSERPLPEKPAYRRGLSPCDLTRITDYLNDHLTADVSLDTLASLVSISSFHFCRLFKQSTGMSPHQYVIRERVCRAKHLLVRGNLSVLQAALEVGFSSDSHLTRHMKRLHGILPSEIARRQPNR